MTIINASCFYPDRQRPFPIKHLSDGTPCIVGASRVETTEKAESVFVFKKTGGLTKTYPYFAPNKADQVLYEIHTGDFVGVYAYDPELDCLLIYSFYISVIGPVLATGIPAKL